MDSYTRQDLQQFSNLKLKGILKSLNLNDTGKKEKLINRIIEEQENRLLYLNLLPLDIRRKTLFNLDYPDVLNICNTNPHLCKNKFWEDYIKNHYFINPGRITLPAQEVAEYSHKILLEYWKRNNYPSWRTLPFIFEVLIPDGQTYAQIFKNILSLQIGRISSFSNASDQGHMHVLWSTYRSINRFWGSEYGIRGTMPSENSNIIKWVLKECEKPTAYWTPNGLQNMNFDIDIYYTISNLLPGKIENIITNYFEIIIFKTFGFIKI